MNTAMKELQEIGEQVRIQDNRCTDQPMFCVQGLKRIGPMIPEFANGKLMYHEWERAETYYHDGPDPEKWTSLDLLYSDGDLPVGFSVGGYEEVWETVQTCFTEAGCKAYLDKDGHNLNRVYHAVRIYATGTYRNDEMRLIRNFLINREEPTS